MDSQILAFLAKQPTGCLAVLLETGPHTATIHFSNTDGEAKSLKFFMQTGRDTMKTQPLQKSQSVPASLTTGFSIDEWVTMQMDGTLRFLREDEKEEYDQVHYQKHPHSKEHAGPTTVYLVFEPTWWRYTDFNTQPKTIIEG